MAVMVSVQVFAVGVGAAVLGVEVALLVPLLSMGPVTGAVAVSTSHDVERRWLVEQRVVCSACRTQVKLQ